MAARAIEAPLSERVGEEFDFDGGRDAFVQYIIYGVEDGHIDVEVAVDGLHTFRTEVALRYHFHFDLG